MRTCDVRIIGGRWRSRKIKFRRSNGLRPTPDKLRETLFNWLRFDVLNSNCLDMFAGSGALGMEALSRGAAQVCFIEKNLSAFNELAANLSRNHADNSQLFHGDALKTSLEGVFDIVFIDPPYKSRLIEQALYRLYYEQLIHQNSILCIESCDLTLDFPNVTALKHAKAGRANLFLAKFNRISKRTD